MAFNFSDIIAAETKKQEELQNSSGGNVGFKTLYPFNTGRLEFKFIGNEPSGLLYREVYFHEYFDGGNKKKVPCMHHMYGEACPVCDAINRVQEVYDDKNVFSKYGYKKQGIMFAKLISHEPENYFGDSKNPPKPGETVLFMFPKSMIKELSNLIVEYRDELDEVFTNNATRLVSVKIGKGANGFPEYTFFVKNKTIVLCENENGDPDENAFGEYMRNMPNLKEVRFPSSPTENDYKICRTIAEEITNKYFGNVSTESPQSMMSAVHNDTDTVKPVESIINSPNTMVNTEPSKVEVPVVQVVETPIAQVQTTPQSAESINVETSDPRGPRPACYGDNKYDEKCANCPWDSECV